MQTRQRIARRTMEDFEFIENHCYWARSTSWEVINKVFDIWGNIAQLIISDVRLKYTEKN